MLILADSIPPSRHLVPLALAMIVLLVTAEMIRRRKLREEYAMLWLGASAIMLIFAVFPQLLIWLQEELQVNYLTIVVLALFFFLAMIVMHFAIVISKQSEEIRQLAQRMAILNSKVGQPEIKPAGTGQKETDKK